VNSVACALAALVLGGGAAGHHLDTVVQDDAQLLYRGPAAADRAVRTLAGLGADSVRLTASWSVLAPAPTAATPPGRPFRARESRTYPAAGFAHLDHAVRTASAAGLRVQIDLGFWAPRWAVARAGPDAGRERDAPDPRAFAAFAEAVARRYTGRFPDPNRRGRRLPAVRLWTTWNEPNNPDFLLPQWQRDGRRRRAASPHVYRRMHEAAYDAIKRVDRQDRVLVGGTAPNGRDGGPGGGVRPLRFLRELACVDADLRPLGVPECAGYRPLRADGYAHHPYGLLRDPAASDPAPDDVRLADLPRLRRLLDALAARGRIARPLPLYVTEYGYESRPPDPYAPFDRAAQARFHGHATYLAWAAGATQFAQFLLRDVPPGGYGGRPGTRRYWSDFQTGLEDPQGRLKPLARAFHVPFWAQAAQAGGRRIVLLFGSVRGDDGAEAVRVERRARPGAPWTPVRTEGAACGEDGSAFLTGDGGAFLRAAPPAAGEYRMVWLRRDGPALASVPVAVGDRPEPAPVLPTG
jgi:hypothetical protein